MSILVEIKVRRKKNQLLKPLIEKFRAKVTTKEIARSNRKIQKKLIYKADSYLIIPSNAIAYNIIYDI